MNKKTGKSTPKKVVKSLNDSGTKIDKKIPPVENENETSSSSSSSESEEESDTSDSSEEETQKRNGNKVVTKNGIKKKSRKHGGSNEVSNVGSDEEYETDSENQTISSEDSNSTDDSSDSSDEEPEEKNINKKETSSGKANENTETSSESEEDSSENEITEPKVNSRVNEDSSSSESDEDSSENEIKETKGNNGVSKNSLDETSDSSSSEEGFSDKDSRIKNIPNNQKQDSADNGSSSESESDSEEENEDIDMNIESSINNTISESNSSKRKLDNSNFNSSKKAKVDEDSSECKEVFVGNLSFNVDDKWLRQEFEEAGEIVGVRVIYDKDTGRSRGFGYVEFATTEGANNATKFKGKKIDGRAINVDLADQKPGSFKKNPSRGTSEVSNTIYVGNLSFNVKEDEIWERFGNYGKVVAVRIPTHEDTGKYKGYAYVEFADTNAAQKAMELHGAEICGRAVRLDYDFSDRKRENNSNFGNRRGRGGKLRGGSDNNRGRGGRGGRGGGRGGFNKTAAANRGAIVPPQGFKPFA
ncbi:RNA-binding domain-containing protein [Rhizophagus clarus]|uniref:RNA-binding domain-containing protein n=1 Tax=Rhizophagus clarus TaxID=94130 RepID=A0A8H3LF53_9GLOM|nr:RNA-binding domain-containing protein [Rhizophagus clarus]